MDFSDAGASRLSLCYTSICECLVLESAVRGKVLSGGVNKDGLSEIHRDVGEHPAHRLSIETASERVIQPDGQN